jgi:beta-ribofuranosylaminobenzene 5'-phosphate synthase
MRAAQAEGETVFVEAPARLHFGVLDLRGPLGGGGGRWFGGIGASAPAPAVLLSARRADTLGVEGEDALRAANFARCFLGYNRIRGGARIRVHRAIPAHSGLGSGTQLALAVARALAELHGIATDAPALARAVGRARRSAVGTWTFAGGGLVVEGGRRPGSAESSPLLARLPFPAAWRVVVTVPDGAPGLDGAEEAAAFAGLPPPPEREVERVAALVLLALLPALADADLATFGAALSEIQVITGGWFASVQGGTFAPGPSAELVHRMTALGAAGVGQSSWGPAVYGVVESADQGARLAAELRSMIGTRGIVYEGPFRAEGARVWRAASPAPRS